MILFLTTNAIFLVFKAHFETVCKTLKRSIKIITITRRHKKKAEQKLQVFTMMIAVSKTLYIAVVCEKCMLHSIQRVCWCEETDNN